MTFEEALNEQEEGATATPDVRGVAGRFGGGPVRRRVFTRAINIAKPYRKKKKKKSKLSPESAMKGSIAVGEGIKEK